MIDVTRVTAPQDPDPVLSPAAEDRLQPQVEEVAQQHPDQEAEVDCRDRLDPLAGDQDVDEQDRRGDHDHDAEDEERVILDDGRDAEEVGIEDVGQRRSDGGGVSTGCGRLRRTLLFTTRHRSSRVRDPVDRGHVGPEAGPVTIWHSDSHFHWRRLWRRNGKKLRRTRRNGAAEMPSPDG